MSAGQVHIHLHGAGRFFGVYSSWQANLGHKKHGCKLGMRQNYTGRQVLALSIRATV